MGTRLKSIIPFVNVAVGATVALPHGLNVNGLPVVPDELQASVGGFVVNLVGLNVTVTNQNPAIASIDVLCEHWHTIERDFGDAADLNLTPQPFILTPAGAGGGNPINVEEEGVLVGVRPTLNFIGAAVTAVDNPGLNRIDITVSVSSVATEMGPGTAAAPGIFVTGDPNTGLYSPGADQFAITTGGAQRVLWTNQGMGFLAGAVGAPGLFVIGDIDTGLFAVGANELGVTAGGVQAGSFTAQGYAMRVGAVGAPSIFVNGDIDTGIYASAANELAITCGGAQVGRFTSQGLGLPNASAANPSLFFAADLDTGLYHPAVDVLMVAIGGTDTLGIRAQGISAIVGSAAAPSIYFMIDVDTGLYLNGALNAIGFAAAGVERAVIDNTAVADEASLLLSIAGAAVKRVSQAAANSGGAGFRQLVVPN